MIDQLQFILGHCSESAAHVYLRPQKGAEIRSITATLSGPYCEYSRTLSAEFAFQGDPLDQTVIVTEPCYWTPALPFLYNLRLMVQMNDGCEIEQTVKVGLRRWDSEGSHFRLEGKRTVLRGAGKVSNIEAARSAETSLVVNHYDLAFCAEADRLGVGLVMDLRTTGESLNSVMDQLDWSSSVLLALVDAEQLSRQGFKQHWPRQCLLAHCLTASSAPEELVDPNTEVLVVELQSSERPPAWLASIDRPVVAIRRGVVNDDLQQARAACDRLQAELAPEFNLAGYFVAP